MKKSAKSPLGRRAFLRRVGTVPRCFREMDGSRCHVSGASAYYGCRSCHGGSEVIPIPDLGLFEATAGAVRGSPPPPFFPIGLIATFCRHRAGRIAR